MNSSQGQHVVADFYGCPPLVLNDLERLRYLASEAAGVAGAHVLQVTAHKFTPCGVTVVALLSESHLSIHTWPEIGEAHVDVFTCGDRVKPMRAAEFLRYALGATSDGVMAIDRPIRGRPQGAAFWRRLLGALQP